MRKTERCVWGPRPHLGNPGLLWPSPEQSAVPGRTSGKRRAGGSRRQVPEREHAARGRRRTNGQDLLRMGLAQTEKAEKQKEETETRFSKRCSSAAWVEEMHTPPFSRATQAAEGRRGR